jgi:nucleotide-binding universal stress UspA family protein
VAIWRQHSSSHLEIYVAHPPLPRKSNLRQAGGVRKQDRRGLATGWVCGKIFVGRRKVIQRKHTLERCHEFMKAQQRPHKARLRKAIERWENEGGRISVKTKEEPKRRHFTAKQEVTGDRRYYSGHHTISAQVKSGSLRLANILATTDFSDESLTGVRYAVALAGRVGAAVTLLHVVELPPPQPMPGMQAVMLASQYSEVAEYARASLKTLARRESKGAVNLTPALRTGNSVYGIITAAQKRATELIVIATLGRTGAKRFLLGSTAERVVRHAPCPVLTVPARITRTRTGKPSPFRLKKILVPIDFSKVSESALPWAASLAMEFDADLILLHVVEKFPIDYLLGSELMSRTIIPSMKQGKAGLKRMARSLSKSSGLRVSVVVRDGKPFQEICRTAQRLSVDLIALTTHGHTGLKRVWLGSTAERTVRHASCPVLVVRELSRKRL